MMYEELAKKLLLRALQEVKDVGPVAPHTGICRNTRLIVIEALKDLYREGEVTDEEGCEVFDSYDRLQTKTMCEWPKYNGDVLFPIPGGELEYMRGKIEQRMWHRDTEYGALRWELLNWMIGKLEGRHE